MLGSERQSRKIHTTPQILSSVKTERKQNKQTGSTDFPSEHRAMRTALLSTVSDFLSLAGVKNMQNTNPSVLMGKKPTFKINKKQLPPKK